MSTRWTATFDCADPAALAAFWCTALGCSACCDLTSGTSGGSESGRLAYLQVLGYRRADLRTHMKRYVKALQILCLVRGGLRGCVVWLGGERGRACLIPCPG